MMRTIKNEYLSFSYDEKGKIISLCDERSHREFYPAPAEIFHLRLQDRDHPCIISAGMQDLPRIIVTNSVITIFYPQLTWENTILDIKLMFMLVLKQNQLLLSIHIENSSPAVITHLFPMIPVHPADANGKPPIDLLGDTPLESGKSHHAPPISYPFHKI